MTALIEIIAHVGGVKMSLAYICGVLIGIAISAYWFSYFSTKKAFNKGICPVCGEPLSLIDRASKNIESSRARGYECQKCSYTVWVTYDSIDRLYRRRGGPKYDN